MYVYVVHADHYIQCIHTVSESKQYICMYTHFILLYPTLQYTIQFTDTQLVSHINQATAHAGPVVSLGSDVALVVHQYPPPTPTLEDHSTEGNVAAVQTELHALTGPGDHEQWLGYAAGLKDHLRCQNVYKWVVRWKIETRLNSSHAMICIPKNTQ